MNSINKKFEITHPQKRIWYNEILFPSTSMHNIVSKIYIGSNLDIHLLEKTINLIIKKNDSFRLKFYEEDGKLYEYVEEYKFINIPFLDFTMYKNNAEKKLKEFCINEGRKTLYRQNELLFKFFIYKINDKNMGICFFIHHLICDGRSCNLLLKQFCNIYNQLCSNEVVNSNVENSYIDFIYDENKYLSSKEFKENKQFWNEKFSNLNENSLYVNPKSTKSRIKLFTLSKNMQKGLKKFLNDKNMSLNKFFISISSIYMSRILNDNDITLAVGCFNRDSERQRNTIGMFTGTMPLRINIKDNITFNEFLDYLNIELKSCYHNQKYPYDLLVQDLELKRKGFDSLFKFCVNYYVLDSYNLEASNNIYMHNEIFAQEYSNIPLHIFIKELKSKENIQLEINYRIEDYTEQQITQMFKGMEVIAGQIINNSNMKISEIQVVSEEEKNIILNKFNKTKREYAENKTVKELFEDTAERFKDKTALVSNGECLTYKELNERANKLGNMLVKEGAVKEDIIPILCDRSVDTIVGMLAIIKSGAAYLPIDEDYPEARINYMLEDSRSKLLLIKKHQLEKINLEKTNIHLIDLKGTEIFKESKENLKNINTPKDLVYVIYTSGSTGTPKGVCVENKNLVKLVNNPDYIEINKNDRVLQCGSLSFDASVFQIWIALLNGAVLHLENKTLVINDIELENYINNNKITVMLMPTPLFNQYCDINIGIFKNLKYLMVGGDVLSSKKVSRIVKTYKNLKIVNGYGPTENTVVSTAYEVKEDWDENKAVPIGTPISNSTAYIMDKNNNLLPIGVSGELCVGGDGISRGYLNREDLTKEKFIENPYVKGEKIYKTGDFAKWLSDGNIDFIGRMDYQVKINGFRIELQEIEEKLLKYSKLKEAVAAVKKDKDGNKYLCSYFVSSEKVSPKEIKDFLKKEVPSHMIPSYIMQLESMPVNSNGKVDRKALPIPDLSLQSGAQFIEPRDEMEQELESIWCDIFNVKKISIKDNFFELGGNSLKAIRLVSKIHKELKRKIVVTDVFNKPSIEELSEYLKDNISDRIISLTQIEKANEADYYEASPVQKRLYAVNQTDMSSTNYNVPLVYVMKGNFDRHRFEKSIRQLINRHEALRTSFHVIDGNIFQKIHSEADFKTQYIYAGMKFDKNKFEANEFIKPFDLSKSPLIRTSIIEFLDASVLIIDMHHIICDGVSVGIIMKELSELYNGGKLDKLRIQYKDYSNWINDLYKKDLLKRQEDYWMNEFKEKPSGMNVCLSAEKVLNRNFEGNTIKFKIDRKLTSKINKILNNLGITKFMFYISVYYVLLYKYTGQEDLIIGTPVSGRTNEDIKDTVGMFVNMLPLRNRISGNMSFKEVLSEVKVNSLNAFENQEYDLKNLIEKLKINDTSLFNIIFLFENLNVGNLSFKDTKISMYDLKSYTAKFDVSMILKENEEYTSGKLQYKIAVYRKEFMESFAVHYTNILSEIIKDFNGPISEIDILSQSEKNIILNKFNNTKRKYAENRTVKELFEDTAERFKDKTALVSNGECLTYKELNERANQLGNILVKEGAVKEDIIPILCDRSVDTIVGILAIIKSGAAYLPIDEDYPEARINYMLEDSRSKLLLIKKHQLEKINLEKINIHLINLKGGEILKESKENLKNINTTSDLIYVIYTSGSTGNPKGVCVENKNLVKLVNNPDYIEINKNDRVLQCGSLSFDASVFQIWIALLNGAVLHLENKTLVINDIELENYINHNKITVMLMPTPLFNQYCDINIGIFKNLKYLMVGGDVLSSKKVSRIVKTYKNLKIVNGYGPTENTVLSTAYLVKKDWDENIAIPIGTPISNSTAYIMDKDNNLLPIGVPGELCVGGDGISRGYLNRENLTKEKFIENPYVKGERIYKTGDFAKWLPDGNIHFIGRIDYQVKINGFRIELQEIEAKLLKYSKLKEAVVTVQKDKDGNKYLCAYFVSSEKVSPKEIKDFLKKEVPSHMIPSYIMQLESMPVNSNGKVDRKSLPIPDLLSQSDAEFIGPRDEMERKLEIIWCKVLNMEKISVEDNFFELGGNSLTAIRLVSKIHKELKFKIVVTDIFNKPSIEELSEYLKDNISGRIVSFKQIEKANEADYYEASPVQKRLYAVNQTNINSTNYNVPLIYVIKGNFDRHCFEKSICQLINRHEALRTSFHVIDGNIFQKIHSAANFKTQYIYTGIKFDKNKFEANEFIKPFDLSKSPLIRTSIVEFLDAFVLIIDMHHIISDGVSIGIIMKELSELYNGGKLDKLRIQYKDYSNWINDLYKKDLLKRQEDYWMNEFKGRPSEMNVCLNSKKVLSKDFKGNTVKFKIDRKLTSKINKTLNNLGITKFMFYISIYYVLLYKYTGQEDLIIGTPVSGRTNEDIKDTVGMFVNMLPLRNKISGDMSFKEVLKEVKANSLNSFENQDYDLKLLIENLNINSASLFNITFSFENLNIDNLSFKGTEISTYELKNDTAKFDVSMIFKENDEYTLGQLQYKTSVYSKKFMENFAGHYTNILSEVIKDFNGPISEIDILSEMERKEIFNRFNDTKRTYPKNKTINELFEEQVEKTPDAIAVVFEDEKITYKELNERANSLARGLRENGIGLEVIVGVMVETSIEMIIGIIAILKAGGAYLPIDPKYPKGRIEYILENSKTKIVLSKGKLKEKVKSYGVKIYDLNDEKLYKMDKSNLDKTANENNLAYVIYTSGTTGKPKGVMVEHKSAVVTLLWRKNEYKFVPEDSTLQLFSSVFDGFITSFFTPIISGAKVILLSSDDVKNVFKIKDILIKYKITNFIVVPSLGMLIMSVLNKSDNINLKKVTFAGEALTYKSIEKCKSVCENIEVINEYGPTENSIVSTIKRNITKKSCITIGKPIANTKVYIVDKNNKLLPIGVAGELCVSGDGLARGYLNNEKLTKERFIDNPYESGERMYKTGDLARWLPEGDIEYLGRIDNQVKIRGFRIELQEIENNLLKIDGIKEAVVLAKGEEGDNYLCAYYLGEKEYSVGELRRELKKFLPEYMLPSYFIKLDSMPLTPNGKVDRKVLPNPEGKINIGVEYEPPRNRIEKSILEIWQDVLGLSNIGINDDFFEIGGNSLKAISVVSKLSRNFSIVINDIFEHPTIRELALNIKNKFCIGAKDQIAATTGFENEIPKEIKAEHDIYIHDIEKYKKVNLNKKASYKNILLAGATGYVGVNILKEIMLNTDSKVHLLLRGKNIRAAEEKIMRKTNFYFGQEFYTRYKHRINILCGDISKNNLGLDIKTYEKYLSEIDCIINSAANVKHYGNYQDFYNTNVLGTKRLLDFAMVGLKKDFNQISTMSVASGSIPNNKLVMFSESDIDIGQKSNNVYVRSKLEAEKLVKKASENSLNIKIFRLGNVVFNYRTGLFQQNIIENAFYKNIKAFIKLKCVPNIKGDIFDFSYVDQLSKAIILLFNKTDLNNQVFHIVNPKKISTSNLVTLLNTKYKNIKLKDMNEFLSCIYLKGESDELRDYVDNVKVNLGLLDNNISTRFITVNERTNAILNKLDFEWSKLDETAIKRMLDYCEKVKFL